MTLRPALALAVAALAASCGDCITIGCYDGLTVTFSTPILSPYRVVTESADAGTKSFDCAAPIPSECQAPFDGWHPSRVTVRVIKGADTVVTPNVEPQYQTTKGGCGHTTCRSAMITVNAPR
jgi:hypothetical protein